MSFTFNDIFPVLRAHFPAKNNYYPCSYKEEFEELCHFGIDSVEKLEAIITKHKEAVLKEDANFEPEEAVYDFFCDEMGKGVVDQMLEAGYWYSFPALLRLVLEKEFGQAYDEYALSRDGLTE